MYTEPQWRRIRELMRTLTYADAKANKQLPREIHRAAYGHKRVTKEAPAEAVADAMKWTIGYSGPRERIEAFVSGGAEKQSVL